MCEMLAVAWPEPERFDHLIPYAMELERIGLGGFGWGVAWLGADRRVHLHRDLGHFAEQVMTVPELIELSSTRFLIHLRRPNRLSTIQLPDTQPFLSPDARFTLCHNGFLEHAEEHRARYAGRLAGLADSEVGFVYFCDRLAEGAPVGQALTEVDTTFRGHLNLGYLDADGRMLAYAANKANPMWRFQLKEASVAATSLHSADESVFDLVFPDAVDPVPLELGSAVLIADALAPAD